MSLIQDLPARILTNANNTASNSVVDEVIFGRGGDDTLSSTGLSAFLVGGSGNDTYQPDYAGFTIISDLSGSADRFVDPTSAPGLGTDYRFVRATVTGSTQSHLAIVNPAGQGVLLLNAIGTDTSQTMNSVVIGEVLSAILVGNPPVGTVMSYADFIGATGVFGVPPNPYFAGSASMDALFGADAAQFQQLFVELGLAADDLETLAGDSGDNTIVGSSGFDYLFGDDGNDTFLPSLGANDDNDVIHGGNGIDTYDLSGLTTNVSVELQFSPHATSAEIGNDTIIDIENVLAGSGNDHLEGSFGDNLLDGGAGDDMLDGELGNDELYGGPGNDYLYGGGGSDLVYGGAGDDIFWMYAGAIESSDDIDIFDGGDGIDTYDASRTQRAITIRLDSGTASSLRVGIDTLFSVENAMGSKTHDIIFGNDGVNVLDGNEGNDRIFARDGNDIVNGGSGNDTINGNAGDDTLNGDGGEDTLLGAEGNDVINGGNSADLLSGGAGDDTLSGGLGDDEVLGGADDDTLYGNAGNDTMSGGSGNDTVSGGDDDDFIVGAAGNDTIFGGNGADTLSGGAGSDTVSGGAGDDTIYGADGDDLSLLGGDGNDTISGGTGNDIISGNADNDTLLGASGDDRLDGGTGIDVLTGGLGADVLVFGLNYGTDSVQGFENDIDTLELNDALWTTTHGTLTATDVVATFATQTSPGIVVFDFGGGDTLRVVQGAGITTADLIDDIQIV